MEISKDNIRCPQCGAGLDLSLAENGLVPCKYCGQKIPLSKENTPPSALYYLRIGDSNLYDCKFDSAYSAYEKAAKEAPDEHTAYFGMALASFRVQYINDEVNGRIQPICHEISRKVFTEDINYRQALTLANDAQRAEYERQGMQIDYIREQFYALQSTGLDYDCFICVKVSDGAGGRTEDSRYAEILYNELKLKGYVPFYSEKEIKGKTGGDYEAHILYALYTSECMLIVCSEESWLRTDWVKNEYTRFLKMIGDSEKENDSLTILFSGDPIERLPGKNGKIQGIKIGSERGAINELELYRVAEFVEKHTPESRKKREEAEAEKAKREKELKEYIEKQRLIDQKIKELSQASSVGGGSVSVNSLMSRARQEAMTGNFKGAESYYNKVLDIAPELCGAWLGLFYTYNMTTENSGLTVYSYCENVEQFNTRYKANEDLKSRFEAKYFRMALQYADEEESKALNALKAETLQRIFDGNYEMVKCLIGTICGQCSDAAEFGKNYKYNNELKRKLGEEYFQCSLQNADKKEAEKLSSLQAEIYQKISSANSSMVWDIQNKTQDFIKEGNFHLAYVFNNVLLEYVPDFAEAWYCNFLIKYKVANGEQFINELTLHGVKEIIGDNSLKNAINKSSGNFKEQMNKFVEQLHAKIAAIRKETNREIAILKDKFAQNTEKISFTKKQYDKYRKRKIHNSDIRYADMGAIAGGMVVLGIVLGVVILITSDTDFVSKILTAIYGSSDVGTAFGFAITLIVALQIFGVIIKILLIPINNALDSSDSKNKTEREKLAKLLASLNAENKNINGEIDELNESLNYCNINFLD